MKDSLRLDKKQVNGKAKTEKVYKWKIEKCEN